MTLQPTVTDHAGVVRYKYNAIVVWLLEHGPFDMNKLAMLPFSQEDRAQFAQLIGYSVSGAADLSYATDEMKEAADNLPPGRRVFP